MAAVRAGLGRKREEVFSVAISWHHETDPNWWDTMTATVRWILSLLVVTLGGAITQAQEQSLSCADCHTSQAEQLATSVHPSLDCQACHAGEVSYSISADRAAEFTTATPGDRPPFDHGPQFSGKPSPLEIPTLCGDCHADIERMNPFGLRTDQLSRYRTSSHGRALFERQDVHVATCVACHGSHNVLNARDPKSLTYPLNVPDGCARCHADAALMGEYDLATEVVSEYRQSVHGELLFEHGDTGAPTCATCHGNHSAVPPGFADVGSVCGRCHQHASEMFAKSVHADLEEFRGCVQCHGGGAESHHHLIERITKPTGVLIQRYAHLLAEMPDPSAAQISESINPNPRRMLNAALESCLECHEEVEDDASLAGMFTLLDKISSAETYYVQTGRRLDETGRGVLLVDRQRFTFKDAKTHLIELAPLQHSLDNSLVDEKVDELTALCDQVNTELDDLEAGLAWRRKLLWPIWAFAILFAIALYVKFKRLKATYVRPIGAVAAPAAATTTARRGFLDWIIGLGSAVTGVALATPVLMYLWPAARGGGVDRVEVPGAANMQPGQSLMLQVGGKAVIVVRQRDGFKAFDASCTHLGCLVRWDNSSGEFRCPCHAAVFDADGQVVSGPPPAPMPVFAIREIGDQVFVSPA